MKTKIGLVSLGCPKNLVDSEEMLGALVASGEAEITNRPQDADVIVVNTCAFIESAKQESIEAIFEALEHKKAHQKQGRQQKVIVTGCLAQRYGDDLAREIPNVDAFLGIQSAPQISEVIFGTSSAKNTKSSPTLLPMANQSQNNFVKPVTDRYPLIPPTRVRATAPWTAYVKISEGCDHGCTFCSIPHFRGKHRSKPMEKILDEVKQLVANGTREINLIAQDTTAYGMDLYKELALARLLEKLGEIPDLVWVRLLYCYPTMMTDRLVKTMANTPNVAHYVDIPLQHGDDDMLKKMKRGGSVSSYLRIIERLRSAMPDIAIRTTFLVGFPGETDAAFENLKQFVSEAQFDRLGVFEYSPEEDTPGFDMHASPLGVPKKVMAQRRKALMAWQQPISLARNQALIGTELDVFIETIASKQVIARSYRDAPEIDGTVFITPKAGETSLQLGDQVRVRVTGAEPYDLTAEIAEIAPLR
jgi:ribosomal protein S12 methylthiotransferase